MEKKQSPTNNNIITINNTHEEFIDKFTFKLTFIYDLVISNQNRNMTLSQIKALIRKNYSLKENEYKLSIGNNSVNNLSNSTSIKDLLNLYKDNKIIIKTFKYIIDIQKEINDYERFLNNKILLKSEEIKLLNTEYENIIKDLKSI